MVRRRISQTRRIYSALRMGDYAYPLWEEVTAMSKLPALFVGVFLAILGAAIFHANSSLAQEHAATSAAPAKQTEADEYTRYELLAPESASFKILYEVSAATPGA